MTSHRTRDLALINAAGFLRSFGVGLMGVVLGIYLFRTGLTSLAIGLVLAVGLAGAALATILVSLVADRVGRRSLSSHSVAAKRCGRSGRLNALEVSSHVASARRTIARLSEKRYWGTISGAMGLKTSDDHALVAAFDEEVFRIYERAHSKAKYNATRFLHMLYEHRGLETPAFCCMPLMSRKGIQLCGAISLIEQLAESGLVGNLVTQSEQTASARSLGTLT